MTSSSVLSISYTLNPPSQVSLNPSHLSSTAKHEFVVRVADKGDHYAALREAIAEAREVTGRELTEWRDAVGAAEKDKAGGNGQPDELDGEDEGEGEGDEEE